MQGRDLRSLRYTCFKCKRSRPKLASATLRRIPTGGEIQIRNNRRIMFLYEGKETNTVKKVNGLKPELAFFIL